MKFVKPFRTGDVVMVTPSDRIFSGVNIIDEVSVNGIGDYQYSTNRGAWIAHRNMTLIRECDRKAMKVLIKSKRGEE